MSKMQFKNLIRKKSEEASFEYLMLQIKEKGKEIKYHCLELQEYLNSETKLTLKEN